MFCSYKVEVKDDIPRCRIMNYCDEKDCKHMQDSGSDLQLSHKPTESELLEMFEEGKDE